MFFRRFRCEGTWAEIPINRNRARERRRIEAGFRIMALAADDRNYVAGAHLDSPGVGRVSRFGSSFRFDPL
jgi:hypothetical protein